MSNDTDLASSLRMEVFLQVLGEANYARLIELTALEREKEKTFVYPLSKFNPEAGTIDPSIICLDACTYSDLFSSMVEGRDKKESEATKDDSASVVEKVPQATEPVPTSVGCSGHRYNHFLNTPLAKIGAQSDASASIAFNDAEEIDDPLDFDVSLLYKILTAVPTPVQCKWNGCRETVNVFEFDDLAQHFMVRHCCDSPSDSTGRLPKPVECRWDKGVVCRRNMKGLEFSDVEEIARHLWYSHGIGERVQD